MRAAVRFLPQYEVVNVPAKQMNGQMTLNTVSSCKVSPQNEFLNALATQMTGQKTCNTARSCKVSPRMCS